MLGDVLEQIRRRFLVRTALVLAATIFTGLAGDIAYRYTELRSELTAALESQASGMEENLARLLARPLFERDEVAVGAVIRALEEFGNAPAGLVVLDSDGAIVAERGDISFDPVTAVASSLGMSYKDDNGRVVPVGAMALSLSRAGIDRLLRSELIAMVATHALLGLIIFLVCFLMLRRIHHTLREVMGTLEEVANEDTDFNLSGQGRRDDFERFSQLVLILRDAILERRNAETEALGYRLHLESHGSGQTEENERAPVQNGLDKCLKSGSLISVYREIPTIGNATQTDAKIEDEDFAFHAVAFDLDSMVDGVGILLSAKAERKGLELVFDTGLGNLPPLIGDPLRLGQILTNLIGNAIKFSSHGEVIVSVREASRQGDETVLHFSVRDQGIGLTPRQQAQLFQAFERADGSAPRRNSSQGLGLVISSRLAEAMGGKMWVESQYGVGSIFHFTARLRIGESGNAGTSYGKRLEPFVGQRVMVIDDNAASLQVAGALMGRLGLAADLFGSARAALARVQGDDPPVYLFCCIDRNMPDLDGIQAARQLRAHYGRACPPLLLMTASTSDDGFHRAGNDIAAVISKPFSLEQIFSRVVSVLKISDEEASGDWNPPSWLQGKRILLVEDAESNQEIITDFLQEAGVRVLLASNGLEALQAVREEMPDCVLMDCQIPVMNGYETSTKLRALGYSRLPIIALSNDKEMCLAAGMNDAVSKPANLSRLLVALSKWVISPEAEGTVFSRALPAEMFLEESIAGEGEPLPPLPPGLDVESGLRRLRGKRALFLKALRMFRDSRGHQFQLEFRAAVAAEDWLTSERLAHSLKGTAATIGANEVSAAAARLEAAIRGGNYRAVRPLLIEVTEKLQAIVDGLANIG